MPKQRQAPVRNVEARAKKKHGQPKERLRRARVSHYHVPKSYPRDPPERAAIGSAVAWEPPKNSILTPERVMRAILQLLDPPQENITKFMNIFNLDPFLFLSDPESLRKSLHYAFGPGLGEAAFIEFMGFAHKFR